MDTLKSIVINLVTVLIFISAVEIITPNKMKKYIKFVLGVILIATILNPIVKFISNGEKNLGDSIKKYEDMFSKDDSKTDVDSVSTISQDDKNEARKKAFINNYNKNCDNLLKSKYKDMRFKSEVDCDVDFTNVIINVKKLMIGVADNKISKVKKVLINNKDESNSNDGDNEYSEIVNYISDELDIPKDRIEVYEMKLDAN